jgi:hypothetical protein
MFFSIEEFGVKISKRSQWSIYLKWLNDLKENKFTEKLEIIFEDLTRYLT